MITNDEYRRVVLRINLLHRYITALQPGKPIGTYEREELLNRTAEITIALRECLPVKLTVVADKRHE
jgi:hypothetical protein